MTLEEIYKEYCIKIAYVELHQRSINNITNEELKKLKNNKDAFEQIPSLSLPASVDNFYFRDAENGTSTLLAYAECSAEEMIDITIHHKNRQYQWLLAEAYEVYEDFLKNIYAYLGFKNNELWVLSDFGSITLKDIKTKDFYYFQNQSKNKKGIPQTILSRLRNILPKYDSIETNNKIDSDIKLGIILIEKLRHVIVHCGGMVKDKKGFIELVLKDAGLFNSGKYKQKIVESISRFFGEGPYSNTILLTEVKGIPLYGVPPQIMTGEINVLEILINVLLASAYAIYKEIKDSNLI